MARNRRKRIQPTTTKDSAQSESRSAATRASARRERREKARERVRSKSQERFTLLMVLAITALAYLNALGGQFVYDDRLQILKNPTLNSLANIPKMFTQGVW